MALCKRPLFRSGINLFRLDWTTGNRVMRSTIEVVT